MKKNLTTVFFVLIGIVFFGFVAKADTFNNNLYYGLRGNTDVTQLQEFLTTQGIYSGRVSGNFFSLTLAAVEQFQTSQGITPAAGYFGPLTRTKANAIIDQQIQASNNQALVETSSTSPMPTTTNNNANSPQTELQALMQELALMEQQLQAMQGNASTTTSQPSVPSASIPTPVTTQSNWSAYQSVDWIIYNENPSAYEGSNIVMYGLTDGTFLPKGGNGGTANFVELGDVVQSPEATIEIDNENNYTAAIAALSGSGAACIS